MSAASKACRSFDDHKQVNTSAKAKLSAAHIYTIRYRYVYTHTYTHTHIHIYNVCMYARESEHIYKFMYVCMYVCMYIRHTYIIQREVRCVSVSALLQLCCSSVAAPVLNVKSISFRFFFFVLQHPAFSYECLKP